VLLNGMAGTGRVVNGENGAVVECTMQTSGEELIINANISASTLETSPSGAPYSVTFNFSSNYPGFQTYLYPATAAISASDTQTQSQRSDPACELYLTQLFGDSPPNGLYANFNCFALEDSNAPGAPCHLHGSLVLENCDN
jgi:hypothetical protein